MLYDGVSRQGTTFPVVLTVEPVKRDTYAWYLFLLLIERCPVTSSMEDKGRLVKLDKVSSAERLDVTSSTKDGGITWRLWQGEQHTIQLNIKK